MHDRLFRSRDDRMLAGVAGGLAEMWDADPSLVRIVWALLTVFTGGLALVVYIVMAIVVPEEDARPWPPVGVPMGGPAPDGAAVPGDTTAGAATATGTSGAAPGLVGGTPASYWTQTDPRSARRAAREARRAERRARGSSGAPLVIGGFLVLLGLFFLAREWIPQLDFDWFWPAMLIALGVIILITAFGRGHDAAGPSGGAS